MFASRYFGDRYYAPRYFAKTGEDSVAPAVTFNNSTQNWLSPTLHLALLLGALLYLRMIP